MNLDTQLQLYFLVFARISALLLSMPLFSARAIPPLARGGLIFFLSLAVMPMVASGGLASATGADFFFAVLAEVFVGVLMGLLVQALFAVFQTAGEIFSIQMAFSASQVFDPMGEKQQPLLSQFLDTIAILVFLTVGPLHTFLARVLAESFAVLPRARALLAANQQLLSVMVDTLGFLFEQALLIALPVMASIALVSVTLGLMAKAAPQMNLLVLGFPIQTSMGFLVLLLAMPFLLEQMALLLDYGLRDIQYMLARHSRTPQ